MLVILSLEEDKCAKSNILSSFLVIVILHYRSLQCSRKQAILHLFPTPKKESLITQVMKDQQIIGKYCIWKILTNRIVATGHTPIFIKTPCIDKEFRIIKKGEEASLYLNSQICLYELIQWILILDILIQKKEFKYTHFFMIFQPNQPQHPFQQTINPSISQ